MTNRRRRDYTSPDPLQAAKDKLVDEQAYLSGAYWHYGWRIAMSILALVAGPVGGTLFAFWGPVTADANVGAVMWIFFGAFVCFPVLAVLWISDYHPSVGDYRHDVAVAQRQLRDARAAVIRRQSEEDARIIREFDARSTS